ncbi:hypothetical protein NQZ68_023181 [Dissostichus eleginoides]|nr:hypothetical protein NQZ68_023181 [Dissostichus eleginoides]
MAGKRKVRRRKRSWRNKKIKGITVEPFIEHVPQGSWCFVQSGTVFQKEKEPKELQDQPKIIEKSRHVSTQVTGECVTNCHILRMLLTCAVNCQHLSQCVAGSMRRFIPITSHLMRHSTPHGVCALTLSMRAFYHRIIFAGAVKQSRAFSEFFEHELTMKTQENTESLKDQPTQVRMCGVSCPKVREGGGVVGLFIIRSTNGQQSTAAPKGPQMRDGKGGRKDLVQREGSLALGPGVTAGDSPLKARTGEQTGCGQACLFDYELFTEMAAVELSDSMRKYPR